MAGKAIYVLTSRPLSAGAAEMGVVAAQGGPAELIARLREANLAGDVLVQGGSRTIQAFLGLGALDRLGIVVLPVLPGAGIPLFALELTTFSSAAWAASLAAPSQPPARPLMGLDHHRALPDGSIELVYVPA